MTTGASEASLSQPRTEEPVRPWHPSHVSFRSVLPSLTSGTEERDSRWGGTLPPHQAAAVTQPWGLEGFHMVMSWALYSSLWGKEDGMWRPYLPEISLGLVH